MSYNLLHKLKILLKTNNNFEFNNIFNRYEIIASGIILVCHAGYTYGTTEIKEIKIKKKYSFVRNGYSEFLIIDHKGNHYNMINSFWYWKWNSIEDWNRLDNSESIYVKTYGYRIPILGIFPNVVSIDCSPKIKDI